MKEKCLFEDKKQMGGIVMDSIDIALSRLSKDNYIIYGTGKIASQCFKFLTEKFGKETVKYFINSFNITDDFEGCKVLSIEDINKIDINKFKYILATNSSALKMKNILLNNNVDDENIIILNSFFNIEHFMKSKIHPRRIAFWPPVKNETQLKLLIKKINWYLRPDNYECIDIYSDINVLDKEKNITICNSNQLDKDYDIVLVTKEQALADKSLKKYNNIFCIDSGYLIRIEEKMLITLDYKNYCESYGDIINKNSEILMRELVSRAENKEGTVVIGMGPSLSLGIKKIQHKCKDLLLFACNGYCFFNGCEEVVPDVYFIYDSGYYTQENELRLGEVLEYVQKHKILLVTGEQYAYFIKRKYGYSYVMGINHYYSSEIVIPSIGKMIVKSDMSVVQALMLPLAFAVSKYVYIIGCDGSQENTMKWNYDINISDKKLAVSGEDDDYTEQYKRHIKYTEELLNYAESKGKVCISLTKSYVPAFSKREKERL